MEIDITDFARKAELCEISASRAELGDNAGKITWANAKREAESTNLLKGKLGAFRDWIEGFGAWDAAEIKAWSAIECNALLLQFIAGDLRELESVAPSDSDEYGINWKKANKLSEQGSASGRVYRGDSGRLYFYMGD